MLRVTCLNTTPPGGYYSYCFIILSVPPFPHLLNGVKMTCHPLWEG